MTDIVKKEGGSIQTNDANSLLKMAIEKDLDVEKLKALMDLRDREERKNAEKEFEYHFALMQQEYVPVIKNKYGAKNAFKYCPLPEILKAYAPILSQHGFSYRWSEKTFEKERETTCYLSGYGHTRSASIVLPIAEQNQMISSIQARGITAEYGRRYSFVNVTGCIVADEQDGDGEMPQTNPKKITEQINKLLPLIPLKFRKQYADKASASKDTSVLEELYTEIANLKLRCQKMLVRADNKGGLVEKQKVLDGLNKATEESHIVDWEAHVESLQ